jgi:hypothetical protein
MRPAGCMEPLIRALGAIEMSSRVIWLLIVVYSGAALSFGFYEAVQDPYWAPSGYAIGATVGAGLSVFALAGALPLIGWACVKFRS